MGSYILNAIINCFLDSKWGFKFKGEKIIYITQRINKIYEISNKRRELIRGTYLHYLYNKLNLEQLLQEKIKYQIRSTTNIDSSIDPEQHTLS